MIKDVKLIREREDEYLLFTKRGMLLSLDIEEYRIFEKYKDAERFPSKASKESKELITRLCSYGILEFKGYIPPVLPKEYSKALIQSNGPEAIYPSPVLAHLSITATCNMKCKYCSVRDMHSDRTELSTEQWKKIIKKLNEWGVFQIGLTGGEPTLREDLVELAEYTESLGSTFNITTNGWLLDEKLIVQLKNAGLQQCQISLDSHNPKTHDRLRGKDSWKRVRKAIELMKKHDIPVGIDTVVSKNNIDDIDDFIKWLSLIDVPWLTIIKLKKGDLPLEKFRELVPSYEDYGRLIERICSRKNENPNVTIDCGSVSNLQFTLRDSELDSIPTAGCPIGHTLISIAPNGDIYPCSALLGPKFKIGNALDDDLPQLWKESPMLQQLRSIKKRIKGRCKDCSRLDFCRGGCRGIANSLDGLWESDSTCKFGGKNGKSLS